MNPDDYRLIIRTRYKILAIPNICLLLKDSFMTKFNNLECSDDLFQALVEAAHCSFILLVLRRNDRPLKAATISNLLLLHFKHTQRLLDMLTRFGFVLPVEKGIYYTITESGADLISPKPSRQPWDFDPELDVDGDRLPTYVAFDLLPLRIYSYRRGAPSNGGDPELGV